MKVIKASEYKVVEQMGKSPAHISLLALLMSFERHRDALLKVLTAAQVPKETTSDRIVETGHLRALHIVCKCNNHVVGRVMIDNCSALNVCPVSTLKQMNVDMNRIRASKTTVRAFDSSRRVVNGEINLPIDVGPYSFSVTFQILEIPNAFSLLLGRPWIHAAGTVPSSLHQKLKFFVEGKLITVNGEEDYVIYKETAVPCISIGEDQNLPFHSFDTVSVIRDYGEVGPSQADRMIGKVLLKNDYVLGTGLGAHVQGILRPIEIEEYCNRRGLGFRPSYHEIVRARRGKLLHHLAAHYRKLFEAFLALPSMYSVTEGTPSGVHIRPTREDEELANWTAVPLYSAMVADVEGLDEDGHVPEIEENLHRLENHQLTSVELTEEINTNTSEEPRTLRIGTGLEPAQRSRMIDFLTEYQEVFAWSYADIPGLDPSIVKHFLPLDTERFPPKRQHLRSQRADLLFRIKEEVIKQVDAGFLEVCNYSEWVANIVPVEKKNGKVRVCIDYRDLNRASPKDNFPLPHIDVLVDNIVRHTQFSFMDGFSGYNQIQMAEEDMIKKTFGTMWGTFCYKVIPFDLKNAGATYQWAMVTLYHDMMHKEVEIYVDDMIAKSKEGEDHLVNLKRLFDHLKKYKLRLNPAKCTFGVKSGKLLGFVRERRGQDVAPPRRSPKDQAPPVTYLRGGAFGRRVGTMYIRERERGGREAAISRGLTARTNQMIDESLTSRALWFGKVGDEVDGHPKRQGSNR
ncbi:hypothetical protein CRG98_007652 [Punica granatum]|uniref:G-patch domain-containing protein n=1 Tax=Punica granatum TaxID=22663 RepID=A0A2I0KU27_PUNGR|nr:hypothetical protein CRG98_007652 [Punica granatum]